MTHSLVLSAEDAMNSPSRRMLHPAFFQIIALSPVLWWFGKRLNDGSEESLGLLTLVLALALAWRDRKSLAAGMAARRSGACLVLLSVLGIAWLPPMIRAGIAVTGVAICYGFHRRPGLLGLLFLSLPIAASMQFYIGYPLRVAAAEGAVRLLELFNLVVSRTGTEIALGGKVIGVDPACSGVRMLWHALVAAMALAAIHRLTWRATLLGACLAIALVVPANILRASFLAVKEIGHLPEMLPGHGGIGLLCFGIVLVPLFFAISSRARPALPANPAVAPGRSERILLASAALLAPWFALATPRVIGPLELSKISEVFTFDGITLPLAPLPPTSSEEAFARSFPGTLSSYQWGSSQVILRRVTQATRRLHASRDCLRAAGFETSEAYTVSLSDGSQWAKFSATRDGEVWSVHERITSERNHGVWTDVSAWYWSALGHPLNGPWQAETVISK